MVRVTCFDRVENCSCTDHSKVRQLFLCGSSIAQFHMYVWDTVDGVATPASNAEFDASLQARDPAWGLRDIAACAAVAEAVGMELTDTVPVPANNFVLSWTRRALSLAK